MAKDQDATFIPFPCETLGGIHKLALKVVKRIAQSADDMTSLYPQNIQPWTKVNVFRL